MYFSAVQARQSSSKGQYRDEYTGEFRDMSSTPFMPLWVSDFLGDTLDLDATEIGAYMLLLMAQWNRGGESLPNDDNKLKRVARCGRNWPKVWTSIGRYFKEDENGIYSKRLRLEAQNVASKREVNAHNGALGGRAKALKNNKPHLANATNSLQRNPSIPEPYPERDTEDANASSPKTAKPTKARLPDNWVPSDDGIAYAISKQLTHDETKEIADEFQAYWSDRTDRDGRKSARGWSQCWKTHIRRVAPQYIRNRRVVGFQGPGGGGQGGDLAGALARRVSAGKV